MRWLWIDRILTLEPGVRLTACKAISLSEPHLHEHFPAGGLDGALPVFPAALIIEGMAQAGGLLVGHARGFRDDVVLAKVRRVELDFDVLPGATIHFEARLTAIDDAGASVDGVVRVHDPAWPAPRDLGAIGLMFAHVPARRDAILAAEAFRTLVSASAHAGGPGVAGMVL